MYLTITQKYIFLYIILLGDAGNRFIDLELEPKFFIQYVIFHMQNVH